MKQWLVGLLLTVFLFTACTPQPKQQILVFDYEAFGPSALSYELLGSPWWQWLPAGGSSPKQRYLIKVVVYKDMPLAEVKALYPISEQQQQDFRYVSYDAALQYLNEAVAMSQEDDLRDMGITPILQDTQQQLQSLVAP